MQIVSLSTEWEPRFWEIVNTDPLDYYFFIFDWKYKKDTTQIYLAINSFGKISGLMLIYQKYIIQLRGTTEAVELLLDSIKEKPIELNAPLDCIDLLKKKFPSAKYLKEITLMQLTKGKELLQITQELKFLDLNDVESMVTLMQTANPCLWAECTSDFLKLQYNETIWIGIKNRQILISLGISSSIEGAYHIMFIATHEQYRNKGCASSIVSELVQQIFKKSQMAIIYVENNNKPAIRAYSKIGFTPYKSYLFLKT